MSSRAKTPFGERFGRKMAAIIGRTALNANGFTRRRGGNPVPAVKISFIGGKPEPDPVCIIKLFDPLDSDD